MNHPICIGVTGASGAVYAVRLLDVLRAAGRDVHLSISPSGRDVIRQELQIDFDLEQFDAGRLFSPLPLPPGRRSAVAEEGGSRSEQGEGTRPATKAPSPYPLAKGEGKTFYYHHQDFMAPMASGSFLTAGMVICPCSGTTLSAVAAGSSNNLIHRAAEVHLKERRKLILVPRETPLSLAHIDNMRRVTEAGGIILPASPGFYHGARTIDDLVDFVVARICDQIGVEHSLTKRWGQN
jgi:4-hydroxy-3-polyprenylbenzoate decarboxylase